MFEVAHSFYGPKTSLQLLMKYTPARTHTLLIKGEEMSQKVAKIS